MLNINGQEWLSTKEAAERGKFKSPIYVCQLAQEGVIVAFKNGRDWLISGDSLNSYLALPRKRGPKKKQAVA